MDGIIADNPTKLTSVGWLSSPFQILCLNHHFLGGGGGGEEVTVLINEGLK